MYVHGGIYADMDICAKQGITFPKCSDLLFQDLCRGKQHDLMIAEEKHPVFLNVLNSTQTTPG